MTRHFSLIIVPHFAQRNEFNAEVKKNRVKFRPDGQPVDGQPVDSLAKTTT